MLFRLSLVVMLAVLAVAQPASAQAGSEEEEMGEGFYLETVLNDVSFAEARQRVEAALAGQGFAILTEIDLQAKFKEKLDADIPPYVVLGACAAGFAHRAWQINDHIGVMLPCTVVIEQEAEDVIEVLFRDPRGLTEFDPGLEPIADEVYGKILAVIEALAGEAEEDSHAGHLH